MVITIKIKRRIKLKLTVKIVNSTTKRNSSLKSIKI